MKNLISRLLGLCALLAAWTLAAADRPNVIIVLTDDQGYGDVGALGNTMIQTPNMDKLHSQSVRLSDYHVDPTCAPTRSALNTGRYSTRTGVWHTIMGRSLMSTTETTLAEEFSAAGYRTAMYGKWHLGDNYPCRPQDQGFQEVLCNGGGGVWQTPDFFGNSYFDDTYHHNGKLEKFQGYCTDVWFDNALKYIHGHQDKPFFCYLATNAPHGPYRVAEHYRKYYLDKGVPEPMASFYGMITNIDENLGRLMASLEEWGLAENTILIFTTDNGTAAGVARARKGEGTEADWAGFNDGMRGQKGSQYEGGHRVPFFIRWPKGNIQGGWDVPQLTAHVDILPTLLDLCGIQRTGTLPLDGRSLTPLLRGLRKDWPERTLFVHSQRIEYPEKWRQCAVMTERWRLVNGKELYDIQADPGQAKDIAEEYTSVAFDLHEQYEDWWKSLSPAFDRDIGVGLGSPKDSPSRLTAHDWHADQSQIPWNQDHIRSDFWGNGYWIVDVLEAGTYEFTLRRWDAPDDRWIEATKARIRVAGKEAEAAIPEGAAEVKFTLELPVGQTHLETWLTNEKTGKTRGAFFAYAEKK